MIYPPAITLDIDHLEVLTEGRYDFNNVIGRGSYGVVLSATDRITSEKVAIKRVNRLFETVQDTKRVLREIQTLSFLQHPNITNLFNIYASKSYSQFNELLIVIDLMESDLHNIICSGQTLTTEHRKFIYYQILCALKYLHSAHVLHRDLKPSNILLNSNCEVKICDFGLARIAENDLTLTEYVATRWYRAPEILLNYDTYGPAIDMWSLGCIIAEMTTGRPLFPGKGTMNQLELINTVLGTPTDHDLRDLTNWKARKFMKELPMHQKMDIDVLFPNADLGERDLIQRLLTWDPKQRMTVQEALNHPFFADYHDPVYEPDAIPLEVMDFEREDITMAELKQTLWQAVQSFRGAEQSNVC